MAVDAYGIGNWSLIREHVPGKADSQCRERWTNVLDPNITTGAWTAQVTYRRQLTDGYHIEVTVLSHESLGPLSLNILHQSANLYLGQGTLTCKWSTLMGSSLFHAHASGTE